MTGIERTYDPEAVSRIFRHESMRGIYDRADLAKLVGNPDNHAYLGALGAVVFRRSIDKPGLYSVLVGVLPEGRGAWGTAFFRSALDLIFAAGAQRVYGAIPADRPESVALVLAAGHNVRVRRSETGAAVCTFTER